MLISILIMAVFAVAAGILLFTTPTDADGQDPGSEIGLPAPEDDIDEVPGFHPEPTPTPTPDPTPVIAVEINSITITYGGNPWNNDSFTIRSGGSEQFGLRIEPPAFDRADDFSVEFESSNPDVFDVFEVPMGQEGRYGFEAKWIGTGNGTLRVIVTNNGIRTEWSTRVYCS